MRLFWLAVQIGGKTLVVIQPGESLIQARMRAALTGLGAVDVDGYELDASTAAKVPKAMIGRPLSRSEAAKLLDRLER
jgi:hypothetical protein